MSGSASRRYQDSGRNRRPRRGDKRRLTREDIKADLRNKEEELTRLLECRNEIKTEQRSQRNSTVKLFERKEQVSNQLNKLQKEMTIRTDELNRSKATVLYRTVERHDESIRRIEQQLRLNNFKLSEEKRLVTEIDSLKKSKRDLAKFKQVQSALDELRVKQNALRDERKSIFSAIGDSKKKEDTMKAKLRDLTPNIEQTKKAIEELQARVQAPTQSSSGDECQPAELDTDGRVVPSEAVADGATADVCPASSRKKESMIDAEDFKDAGDTELSSTAREIEKRKALCKNLIIYLRTLLPEWASGSLDRPEFSRPQPPSRLSLQLSTQSSSPPSTPLEGAAASSDSSKVSSLSDTSTLMSPSASSAAVSVLIGPHNRLPSEQIMRRRPAGYKLQRSARVLNHKPDVFNKFDVLNMQPPSGVAELPDCIQRLSNLIEELEATPTVSLSPVAAHEESEKSEETPATSSDRPPIGFERSLSNPSNGESGFSESSTTPLRPRSPELSRLQDTPESPSMTSVTHDDLLSTSSTICSEDNGQSSSTDISPLAASISSS